MVALAVLLVHVRTYWFLTDDAFIAFRYARSFGEGHGLVFNPGFARVEGYSCFLWVVILGTLDALGWSPDAAANWLTTATGVATWALVVAFCWRRGPRDRRPWLVWLPALFLAANRSFAVWCASGLETKVFELLVVAAVLDTIADVEAGGRRWARPLVLLERTVARQPVRRGALRLMAHGKEASSDYVRAQGVELVALPLLMLTHDARVVADWKARTRRIHPTPLVFVSRPFFDGWYLVAGSPLGPDAVRARFPPLDLRLAAAADQEEAR